MDSRTSSNVPGEVLAATEELDELPVTAGLCAECSNLRLLRSARSTYVRCAMAARDDRFTRYPRLPVRACAGFSPRR